METIPSLKTLFNLSVTKELSFAVATYFCLPDCIVAFVNLSSRISLDTVAWVTLKENRARKEDVDQFVRNLVKGAGEAGMDLGAIGNRVYDKYKDFKLNDYGYSQFKKYVKSISHMKLEQDGKRWKAHYKK